jgi:hypothetical protein
VFIATRREPRLQSIAEAQPPAERIVRSPPNQQRVLLTFVYPIAG